MAVVPVVMPRLGESVVEATLSRWLVKEGDAIQVDQTIAEASTDKADTELPSPVSGKVLRLLIKEGDTVAVGTPIAEVDSAATAAAPTPPAEPKPAPKLEPAPERRAAEQAPSPAPAISSAPPVAAPPPQPEAAPTTTPAAPPPPQPVSSAHPAAPGPRTSPLVRRMARENNVDLSQLSGTGASGRVTKRDMEEWLASRGGRPAAAPANLPARPPSPAAEVRPLPTQAYKPPEYRPLPGDEVVPFTRRRRLIAEHMVFSKQTSAHTYCMAEVDLHRVDAARKAAGKGNAPSYLAYVAGAIVRAVRDYPIVNATVLPDAYAIHKVVNLGVAVDTPEGLVVPVVRKADELSLVGMTRAIAELADKARAGKLTADDLSGGTLTLSNPGLKGNTWGAAVINQPQVVILRMGSIIKRPVVVTIDGEDAIVIRPMMDLVLTYDHRIIDGAAANGYLHRIAELLQAPEGL